MQPHSVAAGQSLWLLLQCLVEPAAPVCSRRFVLITVAVKHSRLLSSRCSHTKQLCICCSADVSVQTAAAPAWMQQVALARNVEAHAMLAGGGWAVSIAALASLYWWVCSSSRPTT